MDKIKPRKTVTRKEVEYSEEDWRTLNELRGKAGEVLDALESFGVRGMVHGSVARGDVKRGSDVDIIILDPTPSFKVELALEKGGFENFDRRIVMATPWQLPKAHIGLGGDMMVTIPLKKPKEVEEDFYRFGGTATLDMIEEGERVPGVDKRLVLIEPTEHGHEESQVVGREDEVAKILGTNIEVVEERIHVLTKRDEIGKTGVFLEKELLPDENFESAWRRIKNNNPQISKRDSK